MGEGRDGAGGPGVRVIPAAAPLLESPGVVFIGDSRELQELLKPEGTSGFLSAPGRRQSTAGAVQGAPAGMCPPGGGAEGRTLSQGAAANLSELTRTAASRGEERLGEARERHGAQKGKSHSAPVCGGLMSSTQGSRPGHRVGELNSHRRGAFQNTVAHGKGGGGWPGPSVGSSYPGVGRSHASYWGPQLGYLGYGGLGTHRRLSLRLPTPDPHTLAGPHAPGKGYRWLRTLSGTVTQPSG